MRVGGKNLSRATKWLELEASAEGEAVGVLVQALPFGFHDHVDALLPPPEPPFQDFARGKGGELVKDRSGKPVPLYDEKGQEYQKRVARVNRLQMVLMIREALALDKNVEWEAHPEQFDMPKDAEDYAEALDKEMTEALSWGQASAIVSLSNALSSVSKEDLARFEELFRTTEFDQRTATSDDEVPGLEADGEASAPSTQ